MENNLTRIKTITLKNRMKYYVRFGRSVFTENISAYQAYEYYKAGQLVGYVQWKAGEHGSKIWRFIIFKTINPMKENNIQSIEEIRPGVQIILDLQGAMKMRLILKTIDQIETIGLHPVDVSPAYYSHLHQRIKVNQPFHSYGEEQHKTFLKEREVRL